MAQVAADSRTLAQVNAFLTIIILQQDPIGCSLGQHGAFEVESVATTAGIGISLAVLCFVEEELETDIRHQ